MVGTEADGLTTEIALNQNKERPMKKIIIITLIVFCILGLVTLIFVNLNRPTLISSNIKDNQKDVKVDAEIELKFNIALGTQTVKNVRFISENYNNYEPVFVVKIEGENLKITFDKNRKLFESDSYQLKVLPVSKFGSKGKVTTINFSTVPYSSETSGEMMAIGLESVDQLHEGKVKGFEFVPDLPIETPKFRIIMATEDTLEEGKVVLRVKYFDTPNENDVFDWLKKYNTDPSLVIIEEEE